MKRKGIYLLSLILFIGCSNEIKIYDTSLPIYEELPVYFEECNMDTLIVKDSMDYDIDILLLNSKESVQKNLENNFLTAYPEYLNIDFSKYSLIVWTGLSFYNVIDREVSLFWDNSYGFYRFFVNYEVGELCDDNNPYVERIAVVTNKLENNTRIEIGYSI